MEFERILSKITSADIYILGDMNINFLNYCDHTQTEEYLNMLYSYNLLPLITKPTRITHHTATLIDHIYTNVLSTNISSKIITADISDHLPIFCLADNQVSRKREKVYYRGSKNLNPEAYVNDISSLEWNSILHSFNIYLKDKTKRKVENIKLNINQHATIKLASKAKTKQISKP